MLQDELTVIVEYDPVTVQTVIGEYDPVTVQIDEADIPLNLTLISNMGPPGPKGNVGDVGPQGPQGPMDPGLPDHIASLLPHPVYDDGPSLTLLYENAKV